MADYGDEAGELLFRETVRTMAYMARSGIMHVSYSRQAKAEKDAERKMRQNKRNAREIAVSNYAEDVNEAIDIIEAAQEQKYIPGKEGNPVFQFQTVKFDPDARIITDKLVKNNISYDITFADDIAIIETAPAAAPFICALSGAYIENGVIGSSRFVNVEQYPGGKELLAEIKGRAQNFSLSKVAQSRNSEVRGVLSYQFDDPKLCSAFQQAMADEGIECQVWTDRKKRSHAAVWQHEFMTRFPSEEAVMSWAEEQPMDLQKSLGKVSERQNVAESLEREAVIEGPNETHPTEAIDDPIPSDEAERLKNITQEMSKQKTLSLDMNKTKEMPKVGSR